MTSAPDSADAHALMAAAVARLVADAKVRGQVLRTAEAARRIAAEAPVTGLPVREIAQEVARQAVTAGVAIQFTSLE